MPELPEVETVVRDLRPLVTSRTVTGIRTGNVHLRQPWKKAWTPAVVGARMDSLARRGKWILATLDRPPRLLLHLGMTGQLTVHRQGEAVADHVHLVFAFDDGRELRFRDTRRFGSAAVFADDASLHSHLDDRLGPEPVDIHRDYFRAALAQADRPLKAILLDQKFIAGVGNIYADESCFRAGLHPGRRANTLSPAEADRLRNAIEEVIRTAIAGRGSTIRDYIGGSGLAGTFQNEFAVYGRIGQVCGNCGTPIEVQRIAGRSSHFCPRCQRAA
jgi:formamidopyrimidine-DNA glycosylase